MAQPRAKGIDDRDEARQNRKAPQPSYDQREEAAVPEEHWIGTAEAVHVLQQSYGNRYVQQVMAGVQAKVVVNPPDDQCEREADRVADAVTRASAPSIRRQVDEEELAVAKEAFTIQCQGEAKPEEDEEVELAHTTIVGEQATVVSEDLEAGIDAARGGGQSLPDSVRNFVEPQLGHDFGQVHIHIDDEANKLSQQLGAKAFTTGSDVFFRDGAYQPGSDSGLGLIAHELAHVVQQGAARVSGRPADTEQAAAQSKEDVQKELKDDVNKPKTKPEPR